MKKKRVFSALLAAALCLGLLAVPAAADKPGSGLDITWLSAGTPVRYIPELDWLGIRSVGAYDLASGTVTPYSNIGYGLSDGLIWATERESGDYVYLDRNGNVAISLGSEYDGIGNFSDGLARVWKNGKCGFIDKSGNLVIPLEYDDATNFSEGLAWVRIGTDYGYDAPSNPSGDGAGGSANTPAPSYTRPQPKYGVIDKTGRVVVPVEYEYTSVNGFSDGLARVGVKGVDIYGDSTTKYGFVDKTGAVVVPFEYDDASDFSDGVAWVAREFWNYAEDDEWTAYALIDKTGKVLTDTEYYRMGELSEGLIQVRTTEGCGFIDSTGEMVIAPQYRSAGDFSEGMARVSSGGKYGFIDKTGKVVAPLAYSDAGDFSCGLARVQDDEGNWGYIDKTGKEVIPPTYGWAGYFYGGLAVVRERGGDCGVINQNGEIVLPLEYDDITLVTFNDSFYYNAEMRQYNGIIGIVQKGSSYGVFRNPYWTASGGALGVGGSGGFPVVPVVIAVVAVAVIAVVLAVVLKKKKPAPAPAAQQMPIHGVPAAGFCPNCGKPLAPGTKFCPGCGQSVKDEN